MPEAAPPAPWRIVPLHVGGVTAVGFGDGTEWLLVASHSGLGVIDAASGDLVARDASVFADALRFVDGIGPLAGQRVALAGLWGGGLRAETPDGWVVHRVAPRWPLECAVLCPPAQPEIDDDPATATMLIKDAEPAIRAYGFSDSGRSLVVAMLYLWHRPG